MKTRVIRTVLEDYRTTLTDSLATELSRAQRQTEEHSLRLVTEALADLDALEGVWNAAIEAAAQAMGDDRTLLYGNEAAHRIRALKREAK